MRWFNAFMFVTFWISACMVVPSTLLFEVSTTLKILLMLLISSVYFTLPISERS